MISSHYSIQLHPNNIKKSLIYDICVSTCFSHPSSNFVALHIRYDKTSKITKIQRDILNLLGDNKEIRAKIIDEEPKRLYSIYIGAPFARISVQELNIPNIMCPDDFTRISDAVDKMQISWKYAKLRWNEMTASQKEFLTRRINLHARIVFLQSLNKTTAKKQVYDCSIQIRISTTRKELPERIPCSGNALFYDALYELGKIYAVRANLEEALVDNNKLPSEFLIQKLVNEIFDQMK